MSTATNVTAHAVNTIDWLSAPDTTIVVPVYQRQYRWDIGGCEKLLADIRAVSATGDTHTHFIGSILSSESAGAAEGDDTPAELVLIDGQQRITTLMLLVAALHHTVRAEHPTLAAELERVLVRAADPSRTKLRPHRAWAEVFEKVVLERAAPGESRESRFDDNYAFFRSQIRADEAPAIWRGLQKLEHVAITLGAGSNAQQIFESLNSTGEPLHDHELIHNYVLMGLTHAEQTEIEDSFWLPIEQNTGEQIASFWRHYLVMKTGREVAMAGGRGVYDAFREQFPRLDASNLRTHAAEWKEYSAIYRILVEPTHAPEPALTRQLRHVNTFGRGMYPLVMRAYRDFLADAARGGTEAANSAQATLVELLERVQSLLLRRTIVGISTDTLVARLCRARDEDPEALEHAFARIMPSDERVRGALKYGALPHPSYVLSRLAGAELLGDVELELAHVFPLAPSDAWSGDGQTRWADYTDDAQNSHRALAGTLGNLVLLEEHLAERALDASFPEKRDRIFARSAVALTRDVSAVDAWGTAAIAARTVALTEELLRIWPRPDAGGIDDDDLTPLLDAKRRRGWPRGWQREFAYIEYRGEHWEVPDVKYFFNRVFRRIWSETPELVIAFSARRGGPVYDEQAWNGQWDALDDTHSLYMGWDSRYMMTAVQGILEEAGHAPEVFVKYSYIAAHM
ncbi:MAG: DUF262 domain-containing protein [Microbacteriaceae bacterium]|nr:DUF262 domain-containing protein [Microbacteriaceae bacterium]HPZ34630.1 DUF262 domain-containing protein [Microbacteriaceae bacterium]HQC93486.1 DUF262 domain-containing protein [Microbacteriaceae bacterium]